MFKKISYRVIVIMVLALIFSLSAFSAETKVIKFSHVTSDQDARHLAALKFKQIVETETKNQIKVEVYFGGQLGGDLDAIEGIRLGTIQMTVAGAGIFANTEPKMGITALPFLFENFEQAWAFNDSETNAEVSQLLIPKGIRVLGYWENGFRCVTNSVRPINSPKDLQGLKIRTPENPIILETMKALGCEPSPLAWTEVYMALQQKTFDGQENPIPLIYAAKLYEVQKYLAITNHVYEPMPLVISENFWEGLTKEQQNIIQAAAIEAQTYNRQLIKKQTEEMVSELKEKGMIVTTPDLKLFKEATKTVSDKFISRFGKDLVDKAYGNK